MTDLQKKEHEVRIRITESNDGLHDDLTLINEVYGVSLSKMMYPAVVVSIRELATKARKIKGIAA